MDQVLSSNQQKLGQLAEDLETIGDPSAPMVRAMALRSAIEQQRDDRVEEMLETAERIAGGAIATKAAQALPAAIDRLLVRRTWLYGFAAAGVVAALLGATNVQSYRWGHRDGAAEAVHLESAIGKALARDDAATWRLLILYNDISAAPRRCSMQSGRLSCAIDLWAGPAPPPGEQTAGLQTKGAH